MGVRIVGQQHEAQAALFDSVTGTAFGPVFESVEEAEEFLTHWYTEGTDLRSLSDAAVAKLVSQYRQEKRDEDKEWARKEAAR